MAELHRSPPPFLKVVAGKDDLFRLVPNRWWPTYRLNAGTQTLASGDMDFLRTRYLRLATAHLARTMPRAEIAEVPNG